MPAPIKAILFDFGRVLCLFDRLRATSKLLTYTTLPLSPTTLDDELFTLEGLGTTFERGQLTKEAFFTQMKERYQLADELTFDEFVSAWSNIFDEVAGVQALVETIPTEIKRGVLSNIDPIHWSVAKHLDVIQTFDQGLVIKSFEQKTRKPDTKMYEAALAAFNVPAENVLYLDDIQDYVDTARNLGFNAEPFDARTMSHEDMKRIFISYGILS